MTAQPSHTWQVVKRQLVQIGRRDTGDPIFQWNDVAIIAEYPQPGPAQSRCQVAYESDPDRDRFDYHIRAIEQAAGIH